MKDLIWLGIGGVVLWYLYEEGYLSSLGLTPTATTATAGTTNSTNTTQNSATQSGGSGTTPSTPPATGALVPAPGGGTEVAPLSIGGLQGYVNSWASIDSNFVKMASGQFAGQLMGSAYHWNFYVSQGFPNANINLSTAFPGLDFANQPIAASVFWSGAPAGMINSNALPGVIPQLQAQGMSGLGIIAHNVNPYMLGPSHGTKVYGVGAKATGMERYIKVLGQ